VRHAHLHETPAREGARGEFVYSKVPRNRAKNTTLSASMTTEGMGWCLAVQGATTKAVFEAYVEQLLVPSAEIRAGDDLGQP
jgi:hypothetical protein